MNEREYVSKILNDKKFIVTACANVPEDVLRRLTEESKAQADQKVTAESDHAGMAKMMADYFIPASQNMGYAIDRGTFEAEAKNALDKMGFIARMKFGIRFAKALGAAGEKYGIK